jgi:hypothetical protein
MQHILLLTVVYKSDVSAVFSSLPSSRTLLSRVGSRVRPALNTLPTSTFESAQRVSAMNSNFYYTKVNMQGNFQQDSLQALQTTSSSYAPPSDFHHGFGSMLRIPSPDPQNIEGLWTGIAVFGLCQVEETFEWHCNYAMFVCAPRTHPVSMSLVQIPFKSSLDRHHRLHSADVNGIVYIQAYTCVDSRGNLARCSGIGQRRVHQPDKNTV